MVGKWTPINTLYTIQLAYVSCKVKWKFNLLKRQYILQDIRTKNVFFQKFNLKPQKK